MSTLHFRLDDLPENLRRQVLAKLGDSSAPAASVAAPSASALPSRASAPAARSSRVSAPSSADPWQGSSKTEQRFYTWHIAPLGLSFSQVYEVLRLKLAPGTFYTPDFVFQDGGRLFAVEVKGSYRLGSAGRAYTAFMTARDRFPWLRFEWWEARGGGFVRKH